jgi:5,10-methylenetetrahydrofolate reductase
VLAEALRRRGFPVVLEITPPREPRFPVLLRRARLLGDRAAAVHVIQREKRQASLDACIELWEAGIEPVWHLATRGRSRTAIAADLERVRRAGIPNLLCLRGDHPAVDRVDTPPIREVVERARSLLPHALIGATLNPYGERQAVLRNLLDKLAAGARYVVTQPLFDLAPLLPFAERIRERSPKTRIAAMTLPLVGRDQAQRIASRLGIPLPHRGFSSADDGGGWRSFEAFLCELRESWAVDAVVLMTLALDPPPEFVSRVQAAIARALGPA